MPQTTHIERHVTGTETVRAIVIGMSDGLTVPLALAAGLSGAVDTTRIIVTAGYRGSCSRDSARRRVAPDTRHPKHDPLAQAAWKKNSRTRWQPC